MSRPKGFWQRTENVDGCWLWLGPKSKTGYGQVSGGKWAHRRAYEFAVGPIPDHLEIDHLCRNRSCINPDHLEIVTHRENQLRGNGPCGINARKNHCIHGHEFNDANTYVDQKGKRNCRTCHRERERERRARLKEAAAGASIVGIR